MEVTIGFAGDLCFAGLRQLDDTSLASTSETCRKLTDSCDISIGNLECYFSKPGAADHGNMVVPANDSAYIDAAGFQVLTLANNHILDAGSDGLLRTQKVLNRLGIYTVGAGRNINDASAPLIVTVKNLKIGIISVTDATHYQAKVKVPGVVPISRRSIKQQICRMKPRVDIIVVCIHSDLEFTNYPAPWKRRLSHFLARSGAHIVIHHHPHTLQGIEFFNGTLIAYSLGNLVFPVKNSPYMQDRDGKVDEGIFLKVTVTRDVDKNLRIKHEVIPTVITSKNATMIAENEKVPEILNNLNRYSERLEDQEFLRRTYFRMCCHNAREFVSGIYYGFRKYGAGYALGYVKIHFFSQMHRNWIRGFFSFGWR